MPPPVAVAACLPDNKRMPPGRICMQPGGSTPRRLPSAVSLLGVFSPASCVVEQGLDHAKSAAAQQLSFLRATRHASIQMCRQSVPRLHRLLRQRVSMPTAAAALGAHPVGWNYLGTVRAVVAVHEDPLWHGEAGWNSISPVALAELRQAGRLITRATHRLT